MNLELALGSLIPSIPPSKYYVVFRSSEADGNKELARAEIIF